MDKNSALIYEEFYQGAQALPKEQRADAYDAYCRWVFYDEEYAGGNIGIAVLLASVKKKVEKANHNYKKKVDAMQKVNERKALNDNARQRTTTHDTDIDIVSDIVSDTDIPPKAPQPAIQPRNLIDGNAVIPQFQDQTMGKEFLTWLDIRMEVGPFPYGAFTAAMSEAKAAEKKYGPEKCMPLIKKAQSGGWKRIPWEDLDKPETTRSGTTATPKKNNWGNIQNNQYDFDQLEKALLGTG